ncbi:hypothetical protein [Cylindrospermopsis raciborskii]|uniref:hypothetical protein n=1 Tax=Cylindrospermopsis raciborskii TaxID=77022 RepID=UPI0038D019D0
MVIRWFSWFINNTTLIRNWAIVLKTLELHPEYPYLTIFGSGESRIKLDVVSVINSHPYIIGLVWYALYLL